jgi:hypothetical protein
VRQQHEREQPRALGVVRQQPCSTPAEPDRLGAQVDAEKACPAGGRVALVEDQINNGLHTRQTGGERVGGRHLEPDPRAADLALGPDEPLRESRLGSQERRSDLPGRQPGNIPQRQRHPHLGRQRWMTAGEDQPQPVVFHGDCLRIGVALSGRGADQRGQACLRYWATMSAQAKAAFDPVDDSFTGLGLAQLAPVRWACSRSAPSTPPA